MKINFKIVTSNIGLMVIATLLFGLWMLFFDNNSYFEVREIDRRIEDLEQKCDHYQELIDADSLILMKLADSAFVEKFARENFNMRRQNEKIFIVE